jgi:alanyl-tRNA synthetase
MNQFKDVLLGREKRSYTRAGGKHNDLDEVGRDGKHLTFFEMLGNWSFGDYYKKEAITWAWEYVTKILSFPENKLYVSVYKDDDALYNIWRKNIGLKDEKIIRLGDIKNGNEENFWSMGPIGPCGFCSEIYFDQGENICCQKSTYGVGCSCDRFIEFWNLVFMEFDRASDGTVKELPIKSVDTGMGLERVVALVSHVSSVFDTDIFFLLIQK